jgi:hypothetical protein
MTASKHIALHPALCFGRNFTDDVGIRIGRLDHLAEFAPEVVVINFEGDVQPPAVNACSSQ